MIQGYELYHWPEFQAFAKRLGIPLELGTIDIAIFIPCDGRVKVIHEYQADENLMETFQRIKDEVRKEVEKEYQEWKAKIQEPSA
jgi:uncharacterized protein (DUF302 family)